MTYFSKDSLNNLWNNYIISNSDCISFAAPFLFFRLFTPFKANEPISSKLLEGITFSISACLVKNNVNNGNLEDHSLSYLPLLGSLIYHNIDDKTQIVKFAGASAAAIITKSAINSNLLHHLIPPTITYSICIMNAIPTEYAYKLSAFSGIADYFLSKEGEHDISWETSGGVIANGLASKYFPEYSAVISLGGAVTGLLISKYEPAIIEQLFAPSHFKKSYNAMAQFIEPEILDPLLEGHYITMANLQIGMGFYGNYLLTKMQEKTNVFAKISAGNVERYKGFIFLSFKYLAIASMYTAVRTAVDGVNSYNNEKFTALIQNKLMDNHLLKKDHFIQTSKTNHTTQSYLNDVETISSSDNEILKWILFGVPKLSKIPYLNFEAYTGIGIVVSADYFFNIVFQYLIEKKQEFAEQKTFCLSKFAKTNEHDKEYAVTILQKNGLNYTHDEWSKLQQCIHSNVIGKSVFSSMIEAFRGFYDQHVLYTGLNMLVANMSVKGIITIEELFLYTRTLETLLASILFKSKNQASFSEVEAAATRLNELFDYLNSTNNTIPKINFIIDENLEYLQINNLEFTRGTKEQQTRLHIETLELFIGNIYAITGANGSGKSSLSTLLQYVIEKISDPSFTVIQGNITYPAPSISVMPQKDYIPFKINLFDLIMYPNKISNNNLYSQDMLQHINDLQVFKNNLTENSLYEIQEDCKELSGGQKKKLFLIKELLTCPKILIADEIFGPLDPEARSLVMDKIKHSCLKDSLIMVVWHQDKNNDGTSCVKEKFFDYQLHLQNEEIILGKVGVDCFESIE